MAKQKTIEKIVKVKFNETSTFRGEFKQRDAREYSIRLLQAGALFIKVHEEEI